jgi:predicted transcriptional regulator
VAYSLLKSMGLRRLMVIRRGRLVGVITKKDVIRFVRGQQDEDE